MNAKAIDRLAQEPRIMNQRTRSFSPGADALLGVVHKVLDHGEVELVDYMGCDEMLARIAAIGADSYTSGNKTVGSILVPGLKLAGA